MMHTWRDLRAHGIGSDEDLAGGVLVVLSAQEAHLSNGRFDPDRMIELLTGRLAAARAAALQACELPAR